MKNLTIWFNNKALLITTVIAATALLSGCGGSKSNSQNNDGTVNQACATGYYLYSNQCYPINNGGPNVNPHYTYTDGFFADNYSQKSTLRMTNGSLMKQFFKTAMGVCDRAAYNYGQASCDSYLSGYMDIIVQFPNANSSSLLATLIASPRHNPNGNYSATMPSGWGMLGIAVGYVTGVTLPDPKAYYGAYRNPLQLEMVVSAINNSTGFEGRGYGDAWTGANTTLLAIQVPQGKVQDNQLNFNFMVKGQQAAQGTMTRCLTINCGL
jgi:hypothetical protein